MAIIAIMIHCIPILAGNSQLTTLGSGGVIESGVGDLYICEKEIVYDSAMSVKFQYRYEYDSEGNILMSVTYDSDMSKIFQNEYNYDSEGNQIMCALCNSDGTLNNRQEYECDSKGEIIKYTVYVRDVDAVSQKKVYDEDEYKYEL